MRCIHKNVLLVEEKMSSVLLQFVVRLASLDEVKTPAGKYFAYHFISIPSKFEIWISKDELQLPVKIQGFGGFDYTLVMKRHFLPRSQVTAGN